MTRENRAVLRLEKRKEKQDRFTLALSLYREAQLSFAAWPRVEPLTLREIAQRVGIDAKTLYRWRRYPAWIAEDERIRAEHWRLRLVSMFNARKRQQAR